MLSPPVASLLTVLLAVLVLGGIIVIARSSRNWTTYPSRVGRSSVGPWSPVVAGIVTFVIVRIVWGSFHEPGVVHDERAYLLQAEIFARGHWTAPSPPLAAFFEQMHVFIEPAVFAKYPPAHALTLVPGIWLGLPGLMPALMTGICRRPRVLARETPGQRVDRAAHLVVVDDGLGDLALVGVVLLRDHEHGDVADRGVGDDPLAGFGPQRAPALRSPPRSDGDSRRGR